VQEIVFTPIANDATRLAALVSGEIDFVLDPAPRDIARLRRPPGSRSSTAPRTASSSSAWTSTATSCCTAA
jgi:peptide/nickel transport system substrate-binding protein